MNSLGRGRSCGFGYMLLVIGFSFPKTMTIDQTRRPEQLP